MKLYKDYNGLWYFNSKTMPAGSCQIEWVNGSENPRIIITPVNQSSPVYYDGDCTSLQKEDKSYYGSVQEFKENCNGFFIKSSASGGSTSGVSSVAGKSGDVTLTKNDVGLSNVNNTSDLDKPISTETQRILNDAVEQVETDLNTKKSIVSADDDHYRLINLIGLQTGYAGYIGNYTLHGFEYTPEQNDDVVTLIGNTNYNTNKPIQSQMRPFEELISTKERFYLRDDVTKRIDGSASQLTDPNYLQKVYIPEFWYGAMFDSVRNKIQLWFSLIPVTGFMHIAPQAVTRYRGYRDANGFARSRSGYKYPTNNQLIEMQASAQLTSSDLFVMPFYLYNALALLMLHDLGRRNALAVWGGLQGNNTYGNITSGKTDTLKVHSGEASADAETSGYKSFRWRFIENFYADSWQLLFGVYVKTINGIRRVCVCGDYYKGNTNNVLSAEYIQVSDLPSVLGWVKDVWLPWITTKTHGATSTTGYGDYSYNNTQDMAILVAGGTSSNAAYDGPFHLNSVYVAYDRFTNASALFASIDVDKASTQIVKPALIY